jgi:undecaprenyl-diphosphatase
MQLWLERTVARWADRDLRWTQAIHGFSASPPVVLLLVIASRLGNGLIWYVLMAAFPLFGGVTGTSCSMQMIGVAVLNLAVYNYLKPRVCRLRPFEACPGVRARTRTLDRYSFPSGHALHAVSFAIVISYHYPMAALLVIPFALVVAISRTVLGLHYPTDVMVGAVLGAATAALVLAVN